MAIRKILESLGFHAIHYFDVLHVRVDGQIVRTCYSCGKERVVKIAISEAVK